jgi:hypothetical protein
MSLSKEKSRAVLQAGTLLRELKNLECSPLAIERVRNEAVRLLRTFPNKRDVDLATRAMQVLLGLHDEE